MTLSLPEELRAATIRGVPAGRLGQTAEVAALVAFLASPGASYINGVEIPVDGGLLLGTGNLGQRRS